ncbi:hypothetical protein RhiirA4_405212 [Rhizophagus irregularis]|uniref:Uncharacterized protein n=1 Tax=Rhizophagus irregularis TaxID=588596 RepID=A0A2I1GRD9_9GLOM|nr:hypothetical protein RhiirA4_405212 [Rhizophagus irregularis]
MNDTFSNKVNKYVKEFEDEVSEKLKNKDWDKEFNKLKNKEDISKDKWIRQARSLYIEKLYSHIWKSLKKSFLSKYNKEPQEKDLIEFPKIAANQNVKIQKMLYPMVSLHVMGSTAKNVKVLIYLLTTIMIASINW